MTGEEVHAQKSAFLRLFAKKSCRIRQNGFDALRKHVINKQKPILLKLAHTFELSLTSVLRFCKTKTIFSFLPENASTFGKHGIIVILLDCRLLKINRFKLRPPLQFLFLYFPVTDFNHLQIYFFNTQRVYSRLSLKYDLYQFAILCHSTGRRAVFSAI